jgi:hypothetical protein
MTMAAVCGIVCSLAASAQARTIGTVLGVPADDLLNFRQANTTTGADLYGQTVPPNDVTVLHITPGSGMLGPAIVTVSITQRGSGLKAWRVFFPVRADGTISPNYQLINSGDVFTNPRFLRTGNGGVMQMDVRQEYPGNMDLDQTRFLLLPVNSLYWLQTENPKARIEPVHLQRMPYGWGTWVQLVAIDAQSARELKIPKTPATLLGEISVLNSNVTVGFGNLASVR